VLAHLLGGAILTICYSQLGAKLFVTRNFRYDGELALALLLFVVLATGAATTWSSQGRDRMLAEDFEQRRTSWDEVDRPVRLAELDVAAAIETYKATHGSFPASLEELQLTNLPSGVSTSYLACFEYSRHGPPGEGYGLSVQMGGIGVALDPSDFQRIKAVRPGSPAAKANVSAGDYVLIADGTDVTHASYRDFLAAVRGPPGTRVTLTLRKKNSELVETVTLTREPLSGHYRRP